MVLFHDRHRQYGSRPVTAAVAAEAHLDGERLVIRQRHRYGFGGRVRPEATGEDVVELPAGSVRRKRRLGGQGTQAGGCNRDARTHVQIAECPASNSWWPPGHSVNRSLVRA